MTVQHVRTHEELKQQRRDAADRLVVLDFYADWCGPCRMISPEVTNFATKYPQVLFLKVDVDECDEIAVEYKIESMPTFVFIKSSKTLESFSGANKAKLEQLIEKHK